MKEDCTIVCRKYKYNYLDDEKHSPGHLNWAIQAFWCLKTAVTSKPLKEKKKAQSSFFLLERVGGTTENTHYNLTSIHISF